jgi:hypothetical protein
LGGEAAKLAAHRGTRPRPAAREAVDDAEERPDRQLDARREPGPQLLLAPGVLPISRRRPPLPWRTSNDPRLGQGRVR